MNAPRLNIAKIENIVLEIAIILSKLYDPLASNNNDAPRYKNNILHVTTSIKKSKVMSDLESLFQQIPQVSR
mgnify:CR=1 FL=1